MPPTDPEPATRLMVRLARAVQHAPELAPLVTAVVLDEPVTYLPIALRTAQAGNGPIDGAIAAAVESTALSFDEAGALLDSVPVGTPVLTRTAVALSCRLRDSAGNDDLDRAYALNALGERLGQAGQRQEALAASEEAVALYRPLASDRDSRAVLAGLLGNLVIHRSLAGQREGGLAAAEEAVRIWRQVSEVDPEEYAPEFATALSLLSLQFHGVGRRREERATAAEATDIYLQLAASDPDAHAEVGLALHQLSLSGGPGDFSLSAAEEAVRVLRSLDQAQPNRHTFRLITALMAFSRLLSASGRWDEALTTSEELVGMWRQLATDQPDAHTPNLADALHSHGNFLSDVADRQQEALAAVKESVALYQSLEELHPGLYTSGLAQALDSLGSLLSHAGRHEAALAQSEKAVGTLRSLAGSESDAHAHHLLRALANFANHLERVGRRPDALAVDDEAIDFARRLSADVPDDAYYVPGLALVLFNHGVRLMRVGRRSKALDAAREAVDLYRPLHARLPEVFRDELADAERLVRMLSPAKRPSTGGS